MHKSMGYQKKYKENVGFYCKNGYKMVQKEKEYEKPFRQRKTENERDFRKMKKISPETVTSAQNSPRKCGQCVSCEVDLFLLYFY